MRVISLLAKTMRLPASLHARSNDLYWNYELKEGEHVLSFKHRNPQKHVKTAVGGYIVYEREHK